MYTRISCRQSSFDDAIVVDINDVFSSYFDEEILDESELDDLFRDFVRKIEAAAVVVIDDGKDEQGHVVGPRQLLMPDGEVINDNVEEIFRYFL